MNFRAFIETVVPYVKKMFDPALLTFEEFYTAINPSNRTHPESAYNQSVATMNKKRSEYLEPVKRQLINKIFFEFRLNKTDRYKDEKFVKTGPDGEPVRINGQLQYYTEDELAKLNVRRYDYSFGVFHGEQQVAYAQDEWGCLLVTVAQEYRGFGIGPILTKMAWEAEPGKDSGGCTVLGRGMVANVHREFVGEYLRNGFYSHLVRQGTITTERVKQIVDSARLAEKKPKPEKDLNMNNPENWLLYAKDGTFVLYDKKLKDHAKDEFLSYWQEQAIKGLAFVGGGMTNGTEYRLHKLGGDTPKIKEFMLILALSWAKEENDPVFIHKEDRDVVNQDKVEMKNGWATLKIEPINYKPMARQETLFRKSFDKYDEFWTIMVELAEAKFD